MEGQGLAEAQSVVMMEVHPRPSTSTERSCRWFGSAVLAQKNREHCIASHPLLSSIGVDAFG